MAPWNGPKEQQQCATKYMKYEHWIVQYEATLFTMDATNHSAPSSDKMRSAGRRSDNIRLRFVIQYEQSIITQSERRD